MRASGPGRQRPRETRSISALTMRSTNPGRLSSSQDFSIGRSISLTRSSSVRALLLSTVLARLLKADSTADTVERDRICWGGGAAGIVKGRRESGLPHRFGSGGFGKFEIVPRLDLAERRLRRGRHRHLVGQLEHLAVGQSWPYLGLGRRFIEPRQHRIDIVLAVGCGWRRRGRGGGRGGGDSRGPCRRRVARGG